MEMMGLGAGLGFGLRFELVYALTRERDMVNSRTLWTWLEDCYRRLDGKVVTQTEGWNVERGIKGGLSCVSSWS